MLQGKWLGHPLHPAVVHIPVGAWFMAAILDAVSYHRDMIPAVPLLSLYCVATGLVFVLIAVPTGIAEWSPIKKEKPAWKIGLYHLSLNMLATLVWAVNLGLRWKPADSDQPVTTAVLVTSITGAVLVVVSGYLGALMVFDQGTSVGRQSKKKWRARAERAGSRVPESK